ncbi:hypothetical protein BD779DRAFT_1679562 [Infundibulicybe gibba]|nr:hypothetical protein BD779DRAFT_1679562 [Infundibulicybe gibba]
MHLDRDLTTGLGIAEDSTEDEASAAIVAFISSANQDDTHEIKLSHLYHLVTKTCSARLLDALNTLPLLVPSRDPGARDILSLIGECCSAKEVVMAVQETIERLGSATDSEDDDEAVALPLSSQLATCVELYTSSIPRLKLRRKTAAETLKPLFSDLETAIDSNGKQATRDEGRILITNCSQLVAKLISWVADVERDSKDCNVVPQLMFKNFIDNVLTTFSHCICSSLAQRDFEAFFPRLTIHTAVDSDWQEGEDAVGEAIKAYSLLGISTTSLSSPPSTSSLILLSHSEIGERLSSELLRQLLPALLASLQSNTALDESLSVLLRILNRLHSQPRVELSPEIIIPLCTTLPPLANHHPDPLVRHQIFRVISWLLALSSTQLRLDILTG